MDALWTVAMATTMLGRRLLPRITFCRMPLPGARKPALSFRVRFSPRCEYSEVAEEELPVGAFESLGTKVSEKPKNFFPKKGQDLEMVCESLAYKGLGLCKVVDSGFVVFCERALPGERLVARIIKKRKGFAEVPMQIHSRCFSANNSAEAEDGSHDDDEGARSGDDSEASDRSVKWHVDKLCPTSLRVRQLKEVDFDDIIEREKKLKIVLKVKDLLMADPEDFMTLQDLGKCRDYIGLTGNKRIIAFLKRYPGVFIVHEKVEPGKLPWFQLTPEADAICNEEREIRKGMKVEAVTKLRKLLMLSSDKRLMLGKIAHIARDIGLPEDFRTRMVYKYPKYFRVVEGEDITNMDMRILELVKWSDRLAITSDEKKVRDIMEEKKLDSPPRLEIQLPRRYRLSNKDKYVLYKFHELECPSPYEASNYLNPASAEAEKRAVLLIKEVLSLTLEKRVYVDHLTHFRKEFKFSNQVRGLLIRHPEHFYVSRKGARDTVFLREAYEGIHIPGQRQQYLLKEKHPLVDLKEKYFSLMELKRVHSTPQSTDSVPLQESFTYQEANELSLRENASSISV